MFTKNDALKRLTDGVEFVVVGFNNLYYFLQMKGGKKETVERVLISEIYKHFISSEKTLRHSSDYGNDIEDARKRNITRREKLLGQPKIRESEARKSGVYHAKFCSSQSKPAELLTASAKRIRNTVEETKANIRRARNAASVLDPAPDVENPSGVRNTFSLQYPVNAVIYNDTPITDQTLLEIPAKEYSRYKASLNRLMRTIVETGSIVGEWRFVSHDKEGGVTTAERILMVALNRVSHRVSGIRIEKVDDIFKVTGNIAPASTIPGNVVREHLLKRDKPLVITARIHRGFRYDSVVTWDINYAV